MPQVNDKAPVFVLQDDQGNDFDLADQAGRKILLVFYPGDNTPVVHGFTLLDVHFYF